MAPPKKNVVTMQTFTVPQLALEIRRLEGVIAMRELSRFVSRSPKTLDTSTPQGFSVTYKFTGGKTASGVRVPGAQPGQTLLKSAPGSKRLSGVEIDIAQSLTGPVDLGYTYANANGVTDIAKTILHEHVHAAILEWRANNVRSPARLTDMLAKALFVASDFLAKNPKPVLQLTQTQWPQGQFGPPADAQAVDEWLAVRLEQKAVAATEPTVHLADRYLDSALVNAAPSTGPGSDARPLQAKRLADLYDALDNAGIV